MEKTQIDRQIVEGTEHVRIYNSRVLLSNKKLPIITRHQTEVANWIYLNEQERIHDAIEGGRGVNSNSKIDVFEQTESKHVPMHALVAAITDIPGVAYAIPAGYQLVVIKARTFTWEEIEKHILLLMSAFNLENLETITFTEGSDYQAEKHARSNSHEEPAKPV